MRELVGEMAERLRTLDDYLRSHDRRIARFCHEDERCQRPLWLQRLVMPCSSKAAVS
jgi:hypothetical protein